MNSQRKISFPSKLKKYFYSSNWENPTVYVHTHTLCIHILRSIAWISFNLLIGVNSVKWFETGYAETHFHKQTNKIHIYEKNKCLRYPFFIRLWLAITTLKIIYISENIFKNFLLILKLIPKVLIFFLYGLFVCIYHYYSIPLYRTRVYIYIAWARLSLKKMILNITFILLPYKFI